MEHSIDDIIRNKVRQAEMIPSVWDHDRVRQNLDFGQKPRRVAVWWLAAAALVLIAVAVSLLQPSSAEKLRLKQRIAMLENTLRGRLKESEPPVVQTTEVPCPATPVPQRAVAASPRKRSFENTTALVSAKINRDSVATEQAAPVNEIPMPPSGEQTLLTAAAPPERKINAILGVIPVPAPPVFRVKRKKVKMRVNLENESNAVAAAADDNNSFTARLN